MEQFIEVFWKSLVVFLLLIVLTKMIGKKILSQMTFFDFVISITMGTIGGAFITTTIEGIWVLLSPTLLAIFVIGLGFLTMKSLFWRKLFEGETVVVIQNGKILEKNLKRLRYHLDDLEMELREKGVFDFGEVEFALLEPHGKLSVLKKTQNLPLTPEDIKKDTQYKGIATEIIKDGDILEQNLRQNKLTFSWLYTELCKQQVNDVSEITYAALNTNGQLYIDKKKDKSEYIQEVEDKES